MKLQKFVLCAAIALTAFGASLGLLEIAGYIGRAFEPLKVEIKRFEPVQPPVVYPQRIPDFPPPASTPTEESEPEAKPEDWGNSGYYYLIDEKPKGFENFLILDIDDHDYDEQSKKVVRIKPKGSIRTGNEKREEFKDFNFSWINITGKRISLITQTKKGISYQFDGKFVDEEIELKDDTGEKYTDNIYLKGRLTKWRDGKKIAEAKVRFGITHGC